jgi:tripartite-type tricarboxylate transporter receptor subunit TctC
MLSAEQDNLITRVGPGTPAGTLMRRHWQVNISRRRFLAVAAAAAATSRPAPFAAAQTAYPSAGPIRVIVPFAAAGPVDILARIVFDALAKQLGQSIVIENRGGAGGNIAMGVASRAKPDGYTLLFTSSVLVVNPLLYKSVPFDPYRDFVPIALLATSPNLMLARPDFARTLPEFVVRAKAQPGRMNYASPGIGTKGHFAAELLKQRAGIEMAHVPYASGGQVAQSLLTGTTQLGSTALPAGEPLVRAGTLAGLAVSGRRRWPTLPDVPTITEQGYSDFVAEIFIALLAPAGTPDDVVARLIADTGKLARDPVLVEKAERAGYEWIGAGPDALRHKMAEEVAQSQEVIRFSGIKVE